MNKIEFLDGEQWCRYNGILMNPENCIKLFGTDYLEIYSEDFIIWEDSNIYTDLLLPEIIKCLAYNESYIIEDYDNTVDQGRGWDRHCIEKEYENSFFIRKNNIKNLKHIKPLSKFKEKYPNINITAIVAFNNDLDIYYEQELKK